MTTRSPRHEQPTPTSIIRRRRLHHPEFPAGYSSAGCSPAEPASASPALVIYIHRPLRHIEHAGNLSPFSCLTHGAQSTVNMAPRPPGFAAAQPGLRLHVLVYSGLMFAALMIGHHFSISARWSAAS